MNDHGPQCEHHAFLKAVLITPSHLLTPIIDTAIYAAWATTSTAAGISAIDSLAYPT